MQLSAIEERRKRVGLTQKALCKLAGVHATTYSVLKNGRRGAYVRTLEKLGKVLDDAERTRAATNG